MSEANTSPANESADEGMNSNAVKKDASVAGSETSASLNTSDVDSMFNDVAQSKGQQELAEAEAKALRVQAELENYRKRARREMDENRRYAALPFIRDLLPVIDNFDRAMQSLDSDENVGGLFEGVQMVVGQLRMVLDQHSCKQIEAKGKSFDPALHEAIGQQPSADHPEGTVVRVVQTGYTLHDRVIRPAQVFVSSGASNKLETTDNEASPSDNSDN